MRIDWLFKKYIKLRERAWIYRNASASLSVVEEYMIFLEKKLKVSLLWR